MSNKLSHAEMQYVFDSVIELRAESEYLDHYLLSNTSLEENDLIEFYSGFLLPSTIKEIQKALNIKYDNKTSS